MLVEDWAEERYGTYFEVGGVFFILDDIGYAFHGFDADDSFES